MIYYDFLETLNGHLKSIRMIKDHISFDLTFPKKWVIPTDYENDEKISILKGNEGTHSFVSKLDKESIDVIENTIGEIISFNIEREEKENLFRNKVQELKSIFDNEDITELRSLKFEFDEFNMIKDDESIETVSERSGELHETKESE